MFLVRQHHHSHYAAYAAIALLEESLEDAEKTSLLVKARRLVVAARNIAAPSYLQDRVARGQPLPRVSLMPVAGGLNEDEDDEEEEEATKLCTLMAFLLELEGGWENHA